MLDSELFEIIDYTIKSERIYSNINLMRSDVMRHFAISRHRLNELFTKYADGKSFPQYINELRINEAHDLIMNHPEMTLVEIASQVGLTPPNLCRLFKQRYGVAPSKFCPEESK